MNNMILQQYSNGKWGYKGFDDCSNEKMIDGKGIGQGCVVVNEQKENESRETFFQRIGKCPSMNEYGSNEDIDKEVNHEYPGARAIVVKQGYGLDRLIYDDERLVRKEIAKKARELGREDLLEKLLHDEDEQVRKIVARQCYGLNILVHDEEWEVRKEVAKKAGELGRRDLLEKLVNDRNEYVRETVQQFSKS